MEDKSLFIGLDLGNEITRLCYYDEAEFEPVCIDEAGTPTILGLKDTGEWLYGKDALSAYEEGRCELIRDGINSIAAGEALYVGDKEVRPVFYMATFLRKVLAGIHAVAPDRGIRKLVITLYNSAKILTDIIYVALDSIGISRERAVVNNYRQSFLYYSMSKSRELWVNDVGMFDFGNYGLRYLQMTMDRRKNPYIVGITEKDYSEIINMDSLSGDIDKLVYEFDNIAQNAIHRQILSTLYMIGPGFGNGWADSGMKKLCSGRRVFKGTNLYAEGACVAARHMAGEGNIEPFIYIDDDMISSHISARVYVNAQYQELIIAKAGSVWYEIDNSIDVIPEGETEFMLSVTNILTRESSKHILNIAGIVSKRPDRLSRINIRIRMQSVDRMIVTIKDKGFGDMYPTTNRIYERIITI